MGDEQSMKLAPLPGNAEMLWNLPSSGLLGLILLNTGKAFSSKQLVSALTTHTYTSPTSPNTTDGEKGASP